MTTKSTAYTKANLEAWNEVAPIHAKHNLEELLTNFQKPGYSVLDDIETKCLEYLQVQGKDVAQVCCNNGRELISVKNMGAGRCVGFDGSQGFIDQAKELAAAARQDVEFVCTDIYQLGQDYSEQFDIVTITIGVLGWMPDLEWFIEIVAELIKPGGALFIYEQHPILDMFAPGNAEDPVEWELSYFSKEPYVELTGLDYIGGEQYDAKPVTSFSHVMGEIVMSGIHNGLTVEYLEEFPHHISNTWWNVEHSGLGLPMCYTLIFRK